MKPENRNPILTEEINLQATKGLYSFFCKSTVQLFIIALAILRGLAGRLSVVGEKARALVNCLWIVNHNSNKLEGISSISSSVHDNILCKRWRELKGCICEKCYAYNQQSYQTGLKEHNIINGIILRNVLIPVCAFKLLKIFYPYLRIESFGDVQNVIQARNYIRIIKAFPEKRCAIWTKNYSLYHIAFIAEGGKPANTTFVISSPYINKPIAKTILENYPEIDHIFTVYAKAYAKKHNIIINCGGRKCMECIKAHKACYYRNTELYINELKK